MRRKLVTMLVASVLCAACGGGGGGGADPKPSDPCQDLGYGPAAAGLVGEWQITLVGGYTSAFTLHDNGTFVDHGSGRRLPGFWGLAEDGTFTGTYSLTNECPPTGTLMTASAVTAADTTIAGKVISSPMPGLTGTDWELAR